MKNKDLQIEFKSNFLQLRKIINSWDLIPGAPKDEFDHLNNKILSHLYQNSDSDKIKKVIESELCVYYGLFSNEFESGEMINEIFEWWGNK